jgi:hypothetical protein
MSADGLGPAAPPVNPAAPKTPAQRILVGIVIGLGVLIVLGLGAVAVGIAMKTRGAGPSAAGAPAATLTLPAGATIEAMELSGERLILRVKTQAGEEIDIVDTRDGHVVSRIKAAPPAVPQ